MLHVFIPSRKLFTNYEWSLLLLVRETCSGVWYVLAPYGIRPGTQIPDALQFGPRETLDMEFGLYEVPAPQFRHSMGVWLEGFNRLTGERVEEEEDNDHEEDENNNDEDQQEMQEDDHQDGNEGE